MKRARSLGRRAVLLVAAATLAATMLVTPAGALERAPQNVGTPQACPVPAGANYLTVKWAYINFLSRCPDAGGLQFWAAVLSKPNGPSTFASGIGNSAEYLRDWVESAYRITLHRDVDSSGLAYWTGRLQNGLHWDQLVAYLFATDTTSTNDQFILNVYEYLAYTAPQPDVWTFFEAVLKSGVSRYNLTLGIEQSDAVVQNIWVTDFFLDLLDRWPTTAEAAFVGGLIRNSGNPDTVAATLIALPDFAAAAQWGNDCNDNDLWELCWRPLPP